MRAHFDQLLLAIAVVGAFGVGRMMEISEDPVGLGPFQIHLEPAGHDAGGFAIEIMGIEADAVDPAIIKRVISLGARGKPACLRARGQHISVKVGPDPVGPL